jgi:hypothetical protein
MTMVSKSGWRRVLAVLAAGLFLGHAALAAPTGGAALLAQRTQLQAELQASAFGEPLVLRSQDDGKRLEGEIFAELAQPFVRVRAVVGAGDALCAALFLHLNVRACQAERTAQGTVLHMAAGPKQGGTTYRIDYRMVVESAGADYLRVSLTAPTGPLGTRDYRIVFEAAPVDAQRSFLHVGYAYGYGSLAKMAYSLYLGTLGRTKIGFTVVGKGADGAPQYVQGERGSLERNVMRNYLALMAYAGVQSGSPTERTEARLRAWFDLTERYAAQLHEVDQDQYLQIKHEDLQDMASANRRSAQ